MKFCVLNFDKVKPGDVNRNFLFKILLPIDSHISGVLELNASCVKILKVFMHLLSYKQERSQYTHKPYLPNYFYII